jgi:hypothetical protein
LCFKKFERAWSIQAGFPQNCRNNVFDQGESVNISTQEQDLASFTRCKLAAEFYLFGLEYVLFDVTATPGKHVKREFDFPWDSIGSTLAVIRDFASQNLDRFPQNSDCHSDRVIHFFPS